jgi:hypothetical protein
MKKTLTVEERRQFYKGVTEALWERIKTEGLDADADASHPDDYDGGRFDFYTTRGISK